MRLPRRYAPIAYGVLQAALTTAVATAVATYQLSESMMVFLERWWLAWGVSWLTMLPVVILVAPLIQRGVVAMTERSESHGVS